MTRDRCSFCRQLQISGAGDLGLTCYNIKDERTPFLLGGSVISGQHWSKAHDEEIGIEFHRITLRILMFAYKGGDPGPWSSVRFFRVAPLVRPLRMEKLHVSCTHKG